MLDPGLQTELFGESFQKKYGAKPDNSVGQTGKKQKCNFLVYRRLAGVHEAIISFTLRSQGKGNIYTFL